MMKTVRLLEKSPSPSHQIPKNMLDLVRSSIPLKTLLEIYQCAGVDRGVSENVLAAKHLGPSDNADVRGLNGKFDYLLPLTSISM